MNSIMTIKRTIVALSLMIILPFCDKGVPTETVIARLNLHIEGLITLDGLPKNEVRILLRDYGSGSVYSELKEVHTGTDGRYSLMVELRGETSRYRLVLYVAQPPGPGMNSFDVRITEELQIINFEFFSD